MSSIHKLEMRDRGSATSTNSFFRSLGMTLGVTIFGTIQNHIFTDKLNTLFPPELAKLAPKGGDTSFLLSPGATDKIPAAILTGIKEARYIYCQYILLGTYPGCTKHYLHFTYGK